MAITVRNLNSGSLAVVTDGNVYPAGNGNFANKSAVVHNMRFVNTSDSAAATLALKVKQDTPAQTRQISANVVTIPPRGLYLVEEPLTLEGNTAAGTKRHAILATTTGGTIDYVISGIERD